MALSIYVDDLVLTDNNPDASAPFKQYLSRCFYIKDLGLLKYFGGIELARNSQGLYLCPRKYALEIVKNVNFWGPNQQISSWRQITSWRYQKGRH